MKLKCLTMSGGICTVFSFCMVDSRLRWMFGTLIPILLPDRELLCKAYKTTPLDVINVIFVHLSYSPPLCPSSHFPGLLCLPHLFIFFLSVHFILTVII